MAKMDALDRMYHLLVRTIRAKHPQLLTSPFSVSELHQRVLPYRHFRRELELETNQEYELILMELLTGARGYLDVDERLRDELGRELASASPEPGRVRDYADAQVSLNASTLPPRATPASAAAPAAGAKSASVGGTKRPPPDVEEPAAGEGCRYCGGVLPTGRTVTYCPHCGQNLKVHNCPACGAELEAGWKFCVSCGKGVA